MIIIDESAVAVETENELKDVLEKENTITTVYFANDITLTKGINVLGSKEQLTIDGMYPLDGIGKIHTYTDMNSTAYTDTICISTPSNINITVKNLNVTGRNYYGIVCVAERDYLTGVVVTYENLTYTGPQPTFHPSGLSVYKDVTITLTNAPLVVANEVAETYQLKIGGKSTIVTPSVGLSAFWFRGYGNGPYLEILEGAEVLVSTAQDVIYTSKPVKIIIGKSAKFTVNTKYGMFRNASHQATSISVGENATFKITQTNVNGSISTIYCRGNFDIGENATVKIIADYVGAAPLIRFNTSSAALYINNPRTVFLYSKSTPCISFEQATPIKIVCGKINFWLTSPALNGEGGTDAQPLYSWYKVNGDNLSVSATATNNQTSVTESNLTAEETAAIPNINLLQLGTAKTLQLLYNGKLALLSAPEAIAFKPPAISVDPVIIGKKDAVAITVEDSRFVNSEWYLYAYTDGDLTTSDKEHSLKGGLVFDGGSGDYKELSSSPLLVYTGKGNGGTSFQTIIGWSEIEGILLKLNQPVYLDKTYSTFIHWIISDTKL